ncbi:hypothetical protein PR048_004233 [Dryococelus australis]|uniref:Uncharacterized protein n=1 Tax=Dryococelus australis TaxID=614101 RepID=A0ABQ9I4Y7_9NEOP|nr:hypothetical protein PR048_004233 [Dryococelus australis]
MNKVVACLLMIYNLRFAYIRHVFMTPAHYFLLCGRDFGHIEKKIMHCEVYTKRQYMFFVKNSGQKNVFSVIVLTRIIVLDLSALQICITKKGLLGAKFQEGKILKFSGQYIHGFEIHSFYDTRAAVSVQLQKGKISSYDARKLDSFKVELQPEYVGSLMLTQEKAPDVNDIALCSSAVE